METETSGEIKMLEISPIAGQKASDAILITGSARSGTTIMGKIVHSLEGVEYTFEPPVLYSIFPLINTMPSEQWRMIYEAYLYEDHFLNAIAGRAINCNLSDDSSIYNVKSQDEINARLNQSLGKADAEIAAQNMTIAYKIPDILSCIPKLLEYYPDTKIVMMDRDCSETLNSLYKKEWFTNENAQKNLLWPFTVYKNIQIPFWVEQKDHQEWYDMSALDRCAYYYLYILKNMQKIPTTATIDYNIMLQKPHETVQELAKALNLSFGPKTAEIINSIKPTKSNRDDDILDKVSSPLREQITAIRFPS